MKTQRNYRVAAIQFEPEHAQKDANLKRLEGLIRQAAAGGAKVMVAPEMATIGVFWSGRSEITPLVETIPGPTTERFVALARELDVLIAVGLGEVDPETGAYYNSAILVGPDGLIGRHRKTHAYLSDPMWADDGNLGFQVWDTPLGKLGMMICMDANYPESGRLLGLAGAEVMLMPVAWVVEVCPAPLWITRAFDNGIPAICANRWGAEHGFSFSGGSVILNPDGSIQHCLTRGSTDEIVYGEIHLDDSPVSAGRRPELYNALTLNRYLWNPLTMHGHFGEQPLPEGTQFCAAALEYSQPASSVETGLEQLSTLASNANLLVLPEYSFSPVPRTPEMALSEAESIPGATTQALEAWCARTGSYIVAGLVEQEADRLYNTFVLVGPEGFCARYRKTHLSREEQSWATPGDALVWSDTPLGRIGLLAGDDLLYPEPIRCLAIEGADVICVPAALKAPEPIRRSQVMRAGDDTIHWHLARTRACENDVYVIFSNRHDEDYMGHSGIFFGPMLFVADSREAFAATPVHEGSHAAMMQIDTDNPVLRTRPGLARRLTAYYRPLVERSAG